MTINTEDLTAALNCVVFCFEKEGVENTCVKAAPTLSSTCIQEAWRALQEEQPVEPAQVVKIHSDWEATDEDVEFLKSKFPKAEFSYYFERPQDPAQWESALTEASSVLENLMVEQSMSEGRASEELLPVLRHFDPADAYAEAVTHIRVFNGFAVFLATTGIKEESNNRFIDYKLKNQVEEEGADADALWQEAFRNLIEGLKIVGLTSEGHEFIMLQRETGFAAAALALGSLGPNAKSWTKAEEIVIGIPDPDSLFLCDAASPAVETIRQIIRNANSAEGIAYLKPSLLLLKDDELTVLETHD